MHPTAPERLSSEGRSSGGAGERPRRSTAAPFSLEAVPPPSLHGDLDCEPRRQYRHLDVYGRVELANDEPQSRSADRLARAGRCQPADVPARHSGGGPRRHHRPAALADYRRGRQYGDRRRLRGAHLAQSRDRGPLAPLHGSDQRVRGVHGARLAVGDPAARAQAGPACRDRGEQHRLQSQPRDRTGARRRVCGRIRHRFAILDQCGEQSRYQRRIDMVASTTSAHHTLTGRAVRARDPRRITLRAV